jgi:soluble lytic murein transglycosylase-like protein
MTGHRLLVVLAVLLCATASPAAAQIYALRDADGVLILSDKPLGDGAQTYAVPGTSGVRTTRAASPRSPASRSTAWDEVIDEEAAANGVRGDLVRAVIQVESAFNPRARSPKGAMGLMQLMPQTAAELGVNPWNPEENIRGGVAYLRSLLDRFGGNEELALAAYNAGPGAVAKYGHTIPPYRETRDYVKKIRARTETTTVAGPKTVVYRVVEVVDGEEIVRYTSQKPASGTYEVVRGRRAVEQ